MAPNDHGFANDDLQELKSHLLELKLAFSIVPTHCPQRKAKKTPKTNSTSLSDTKDAIMEKVDFHMVGADDDGLEEEEENDEIQDPDFQAEMMEDSGAPIESPEKTDIVFKVAWPNGKASDYESEDSGFDPQRDHN
ncbi:hypothetical protein FHETE_612 [Fusarium heterosporum]|uniref:Uncharacterized protein n=1 Tax=Fusarium heterosporum TaxID=42747 RepID=A0A8H5U2X2_FUSHE|nr:hypothetical protein FHETE_612 [Fusarium heterosporum]